MNPINRLLLWGAVALAVPAGQAIAKHLDRRERKRRLDPSTWSDAELVTLVARRRIQIEDAERESTMREKVAGAIFGAERVPLREVP